MSLMEEQMERVESNTDSLNLDDVIWVSDPKEYLPPARQEFSYLKRAEVAPLATGTRSLVVVSEIELDIDGFSL